MKSSQIYLILVLALSYQISSFVLEKPTDSKRIEIQLPKRISGNNKEIQSNEQITQVKIVKKETREEIKGKDKTLKKQEIVQESQNSINSCSRKGDRRITNKEKYIDCIVGNLSLDFFFTAFAYYKLKFKKNYPTVQDEIDKFRIFTKNYMKILK